MLKNKLVFAETVSAAFSYTIYSTDVGIIAKALLFSPKIKQKNYIDLPENYAPINQGVVLLNKNGEEFYKFLFSKKAKEIFKKYGYVVEE